MADTPPAFPILTHSLALAMVASSEAPLLLLDGDLNVIGISRSFCRAFDIPSASAPGRSIFALGAGEWNLPRLRSLLTGTASGMAAIDAYEMDLNRGGRETRRLIIQAEKLDYDDPETTRVLMTVSDLTEARIAEKFRDDLLREKAVLLQEVQHRVANSLQIIASVLLQSARNVQSEETRVHLHDAHNRVMSIATLQKQLALSGLDSVELLPYLTQLCQSLGASMIRDHALQSIEVSGDKGAVDPDTSVSLGLIVTELVINALKHAFPGGRAGRIRVGYTVKGPNWMLSVRDNGIGMPADISAGLGASLVEALARQLKAYVRVEDAKPGTAVCIVHTPIAAIDADASPSGV